MNNWIMALMEANLFLVVFWGFHRLVLKNTTALVFSRFYLLGTLAISIFLPLLPFQSSTLAQPITTVLDPVVVTRWGNPLPADLNVWNIVLGIYLIGAAFFLVRMGMSMTRIIRLIKRNPRTRTNRYTLVALPKGWPAFSFFRFLFWDPGIAEHDRNLIEQHEWVHIRQRHTLDRLLVELLQIIFWYNPVLGWYKRELALVHEYLADREVIAGGSDVATYSESLLAGLLGRESLAFTQAFFTQSTLKNRLQMMQKTNRTSHLFWKAALMLPLIAGMTAFVACENNLTGTTHVAGTTEVALDEVDQLASFPGGMEALIKFMGENIEYTEEAKKENIEGRVIVGFEVATNGVLEKVTIEKGLGYGLDEVVLTAMNKMPAWTPAQKNGKAVRSKMKLPVQFKLPIED